MQSLAVAHSAPSVAQQNRERVAQAKQRSWYCREWGETHNCTWGQRCQWAHGFRELLPQRVDAFYKQAQCRNALRKHGCAIGRLCKHLHAGEHVKSVRAKGSHVQGLYDGDRHLIRLFIRHQPRPSQVQLQQPQMLMSVSRSVVVPSAPYSSSSLVLAHRAKEEDKRSL